MSLALTHSKAARHALAHSACTGLIDFMRAAPESCCQLSGSVMSLTPSTKVKIDRPYGNSEP